MLRAYFHIQRTDCPKLTKRLQKLTIRGDQYPFLQPSEEIYTPKDTTDWLDELQGRAIFTRIFKYNSQLLRIFLKITMPESCLTSKNRRLWERFYSWSYL